MGGLAELRAQSQSGPAPLPRSTRTVTRVEGQHLLAQVQQMKDRMVDLLLEIDREHEAARQDRERAAEDGRDRTRKAGQKADADDTPDVSQDPRVVALRDEMRTLGEQLAEFQADVDLEGMSGGEWQRYKDEHPARDDSRSDLQYAHGLVNSTDLFNDLGRFVKTWEGETLLPDDWDSWLGEQICYADRRDLVTEIVDIHEARLARAPKSSSGSSPTEVSATD